MKTASIFEELEGRTIDGKFALLERLGGSDECGVFLTLRLGGQRALLKLVRAEGAQADACLAQWEAAKALSHPHLIRVFEFGHAVIDTAPLIYVVTESADAVLASITSERGLDPLETRDTFGPLLDALSYLHASGIVHGHIKPSNAFRIGTTVKLSADNFLVVPGVSGLAHKPSAYDAPEISSGKFAPAADVWSIGMMLCEALTQQFPHLSADGSLVIPESMPKSFAAIAEDCLRLNPDQRCTVSEIIPRLAPGLSLPPEFFSAPSKAAPPLPPPSREERVSSFSPEELKLIESLKTPPVQNGASLRAPDRDAAPPPSRWRQDDPAPAPINQFGSEPVRGALPKAEPPQKASSSWQSKWESDTSTPLPELFSQYEEKESRRFHLAPFLLGILVLLGVAGVVLIRSGKIDITDLEQTAEQKFAALTHRETIPPPPAQQATATEPSATPAAPQTPAADQSASDTPAESPEQQSAASPAVAHPSGDQPESAAAQPAVTQASTAAPAKAQAAAPAPAQSPTPQTPAPTQTEAALPANADGAVAHQVLPSVSQAALASMHGSARVVIRVNVNRQGDVSSADYVSPGEGNYFARVSHRAAEQWKFQAPRSHGHPETSTWTLHFYFTGSNVDVTAVQEEP